MGCLDFRVLGGALWLLDWFRAGLGSDGLLRFSFLWGWCNIVRWRLAECLRC